MKYNYNDYEKRILMLLTSKNTGAGTLKIAAETTAYDQKTMMVALTSADKCLKKVLQLQRRC
jgi:hypothetical protein